jgi:type II secretory pathway component PulF
MASTDEKIDMVRIDLEETKNVMKKNIDSMIERGEKIDYLEDRSEQLQKNAGTFKIYAKKLKNNLCCQSFLTTVVVGLIILFVLAIIIVPLMFKFIN